MDENAEMRARVKLLCPGAMPCYGEKGEQRTALHRAVWELFGPADGSTAGCAVVPAKIVPDGLDKE